VSRETARLAFEGTSLLKGGKLLLDWDVLESRKVDSYNAKRARQEASRTVSIRNEGLLNCSLGDIREFEATFSRFE